jgi:hypothetical protein
MGIPISVVLDVVTIRNSTVPYQGSGDHKDIRIYHSFDDPYGDGHKEGICHINIGSLVITLVINDQMDLLRESLSTHGGPGFPQLPRVPPTEYPRRP